MKIAVVKMMDVYDVRVSYRGVETQAIAASRRVVWIVSRELCARLLDWTRVL